MKRFLSVILIMGLSWGTAIADSLNVRTVGSYDISDMPARVFVSDPYAYVSYYEQALRVIDVSTPASPTEVGSIGAPNYSYPNEIHLTGTLAYLAYGQWADSSWVITIDVSTPSAPTEVNVYDPVMRAHDVFATSSRAYIAECDGLRTLNVTTPSSPVELGWCEVSVIYHPPRIDVSEPYVYWGGKNSFRVIDVTDPSQPYEIGDCELPATAWDVRVMGNYAYVALYEPPALYVLDVSDPADPVVAGSLSLSGYGQAVDVSDTLAFMALSYEGLKVIDISDPTSPHEVGFYDTPNIAEDVFYSSGYIYVTCHSAGLHIYEYGDFPVSAEELPLSQQIKLSASLNRLSYEVPGKSQLILFSSDGRQVHSQVLSGKSEWDAPSSLPGGVYFARVSNGVSSARTKLVVFR